MPRKNKAWKEYKEKFSFIPRSPSLVKIQSLMHAIAKVLAIARDAPGRLVKVWVYH